ncbi:MAG TPA: alpha/beta fold hydrolase [Solirubrobacterales bacterium]|nr:alpha/beta fold hydrolase [Solirubrobacterales bacterium]
MGRRARFLIAAVSAALALVVGWSVAAGPAPPPASAATRSPATTSLGAVVPKSVIEPTPPRPQLRTCYLGMPRPFECGHIVVPALRGDPALGTTKVAFAIRRRRDTSQPSLGAIVAMDGGPGYAATAKPYAASLIAALGPVLRRRDLVLYDMRGTGRSDAIDCPALQAGLTQESIAIGQCANQLGPRYAGYTSAEGAEDLDLLRRALGLGKIFFYGDSYGTFFGQAYAVRHPGSLRGLILDSAYPGNDPYYRTLLPAGLEGLRIACRDAPTCGGDPVARLTRVVGIFHRRRLSTEPLISFLLEAGTLAPRSYLSLDEGDRRFLAGDPRRLDRLLAPGPAGEKLSEYSNGLAISVECNDYKLLWDAAAPLSRRIAELSAAVRGLPRNFFAPFGRKEYLLSEAARLTPCLYWPGPPAGGFPAPIPSGWRAPRSFPTLITAGQVDDVTSVREAHQVQARFPRSHLYVVPDRGHVSSLYFPFRSPAVGVIRRFITAH